MSGPQPRSFGKTRKLPPLARGRVHPAGSGLSPDRRDRGEAERVIGVEQWAEIKRMHLVDEISIREINRRTGLHRETIRRALAAEGSPAYRRAKAASKLDPFKEKIERLLRASKAFLRAVSSSD